MTEELAERRMPPARDPTAVRIHLALAMLAFTAMGCGPSARIEAPLARTPDNARTPDATLVRFEARTDERWSLRRADGSFVCTLPCSYWVRPSSGLTLRLESYGADNLENASFVVPDRLPAQPGEMLTVSVDRTHGLGWMGKLLAAPAGAIFSLMGAGFLGISIASLATGSEDTTTTVSGEVSSTGEAPVQVSASGESTTHGTAAALTGLAVGVGCAAIAALSWYWFAHDREGSMEFSEPSPAPRAKVRVTPVGLAIETRRARGVLTPAGIAVEF